ncbi:hypothetical protein [Hymenobacter cellulosivorans]|uniref:Uncharacterized protein n=1 Tax=Hymenobacter cellulosivorans TaxID=2932249 RepID=A0ABY4FCH1_9BACT|nr:hypothetical protein [Hymenobacter cellulosivorans]UOQ54352.1 hypothetical protein MUN80_06230 [Hymenobacter cellulosivorans]
MKKLLTIDSGFVLTGLGVLVRSPAEQAAEPLRRFALYTTLPVELVFADGRHYSTTASVEEVARSHADGSPARPEPALLLHLTEPLDVPPGTEVWLSAEPAPTDWL